MKRIDLIQLHACACNAKLNLEAADIQLKRLGIDTSGVASALLEVDEHLRKYQDKLFVTPGKEKHGL